MPQPNNTNQQPPFRRPLSRNLTQTSTELTLPVLDINLHPTGIWKPKVYTKGLISDMLRALNEV